MSDGLSFGEKLRRAGEAGPPTQAEIDAYYASAEYRQAMAEYRAERERERRPARTPAPAPASSTRTTPRTRERRDTGGQTAAGGDDSDPGEPPDLAAALGAAAGIPADEFAAWGQSARAVSERVAIAEQRAAEQIAAAELSLPDRRRHKAEVQAIAADVFASYPPPSKFRRVERAMHIRAIASVDRAADRPLVQTLRDIVQVNALAFEPPFSSTKLERAARRVLADLGVNVDG